MTETNDKQKKNYELPNLDAPNNEPKVPKPFVIGLCVVAGIVLISALLAGLIPEEYANMDSTEPPAQLQQTEYDNQNLPPQPEEKAVEAEAPKQPVAAEKKIADPVTESEALITCQTLYEQSARYDSKIGIFSPYKRFKTSTSWVLKIEGKLQNGFGAWQKMTAHCEVPFERLYPVYDTRNIKVFEFLPVN